jgi:hypothetical protein
MSISHLADIALRRSLLQLVGPRAGKALHDIVRRLRKPSKYRWIVASMNRI